MARMADDIAIFDFISHEEMHLQFNEAYLRTLRAAFPHHRLSFHACAGHVANLGSRIGDVPNVTLGAIPPFQPPFGLSKHNPLGARLAAQACLETMRRATAGRTVLLFAVLGVDAALYATFGRRWSAPGRPPLHLILHGQLGDAMIWRSRNPLIRAFDLRAAVRRALPPSVRLIALELGVAEAIREIAPRNDSVLVLEHPILEAEWSDDRPPAGDRLAVAFLGNARRSKGFGIFAALALRTRREDLEFQSIGIAAPDTASVDVSGLSIKPSPVSLSRAEYLAQTRQADIVCLPLHSRAYDFTASGTVSDAVAALKPIIALRSRTLEAIVARYGSIGWLVDSEAELFDRVQTLDRAAFLDTRMEWTANLRAIREARRPDVLAAQYRRLVAATVGGDGVAGADGVAVSSASGVKRPPSG
jgi:hypothetical protein